MIQFTVFEKRFREELEKIRQKKLGELEDGRLDSIGYIKHTTYILALRNVISLMEQVKTDIRQENR